MHKPIQFSGGAHAIVLFHGLSSSPLELQIIARGLSRAGYSVLLPTVTGLTWEADSVSAPNWRHWVASATEIVERERERYDSISIGGLCIGAVLALHVAAKYPALVTSVLSLSTTLHYDGWSLPWYRSLLPLAAFLPLGHRYRFRERWPWGVKDPRMRQWIELQMNSAGESAAGASALGAPHLLEARRLIRNTRPQLARVTSPTLVIHAEEDEVASPRSAEEVIRSVRAERTRLVLLRNSYHMISLDQEKQRVVEEITDFLATLHGACQNHLGSSPNVVPLSRPRFAEGK